MWVQLNKGHERLKIEGDVYAPPIKDPFWCPSTDGRTWKAVEVILLVLKYNIFFCSFDNDDVDIVCWVSWSPSFYLASWFSTLYQARSSTFLLAYWFSFLCQARSSSSFWSSPISFFSFLLTTLSQSISIHSGCMTSSNSFKVK